MADLDKKQAREFVDDIRINNGGVTDEDRETASASILRSVASLRTALAATTQILAEELYTTPTRFVFELIQNAEDNQYSFAKASGTKPYLRFYIDHTKVVIDSNEDGFSKENVEAICKVRSSTKTGVRGYIGEKGIGFKSVFQVASKVHVQSGPFSFCFNYGGDPPDGMGMVTPFHHEHEELPLDVRTRFTLTLKPDQSFQALVREFADLPDTLILFLTSLKNLQISINDKEGLSERTYEYISEASTKRALIVRDSTRDGERKTYFFKYRRKLHNLPLEKARKDISDADVVLAFPVDRNDVPVIEQQYVYAYLPLRKVGFPFLIQSDFVTQASREDVLHSPWNKALLMGAAVLFVAAVTRFCENLTLQYLWPRYLPTEVVLDQFWAQLQEEIKNQLALVRVLRTWTSGTLKCIKHLRYLVPDLCDDQGEPLFKDLADEIYLSYEYSETEVSKLRAVGLNNIYISEFWDRLKADLRSPASKMKSPQTTVEWHSRSAKSILSNIHLHQQLKEVQSFEMLPLRDGVWTSIATAPVFYHDIAGVDVPLDLGLRLLAPAAAAHPERKGLFDTIGVRSCDATEIKKLIVRKYAKWNNVDLRSSVSHIRFLFHHCLENEQPIDKTMCLFDAGGAPVYRTRVALGRSEMIVDDIYFDEPGTYNVSVICAKGSSPDRFNIHTVHPAYMEYENETSMLHGLSWKAWLQKHAGVLHTPRLLDPRNSLKLSPLFNWIISKRPESFLGVLKTHWQTYKGLMKQEIVAALRQVTIKIRRDFKTFLHDTFVPTAGLVALALSLGVKDEVRFLTLPSDLAEASPENWLFLETFGVGVMPDLKFYLETLRASICGFSTNQSQRERSKILTIYEAIEERATVDDHPRVRVFFRLHFAIHAKNKRLKNLDRYSWTALDKCVWNGPKFLTTYSVLAEHDDFQLSSRCCRLFTSILEISDANWSHTLEQIAYEKTKLDSEDQLNARTNISSMYQALWTEVKDSNKWATISEKFEKKSLIYIPPNEWHSPSNCVWNDRTYIPGKFPIAALYHGLKTFFVGRLKVQSPSLQSQIQELQNLCSRQDVSDKFFQVTALIKEISSLNPSSVNMHGILHSTIIPVKDEHGYEKLLRPIETFAIGDRQQYVTIFTGKIAILAIPLEKLRDVRNFLSALGLENRYMSRLVHETSKVANAPQDFALSRDFRQRAYSLVRCAVHFESPRTKDRGLELYRELTRTVVYQSDEVTRTVSLKLDGRVLATQTTSGNLHLESDNSSLKLYVPKDRKSRMICYVAQIPARLAVYFCFADQAAVKVIGDVFKVDTDCLDGLLLELGIPETPDLQQLTDKELGAGENETYMENVNQASGPTYLRACSSSLAPTTPSVSSFMASTSATAVTQSRATTPEIQTTPMSDGRQSFNFVRPVDLAQEPANQLNAYITQYRILLDRVIRAGEIGTIPSNYTFLASRTTNSTTVTSDLEAVFGIRSQDMIAHDMRIGAAGELYAFEILQTNLTSFGIDNWRSTIRHNVSVHEKYRDIEPWTGRETADIVYEDQSSKLTALLIAYGYLPFLHWLNKTPTYYLEVKTTTGPCDTRFFMSKAQVRRMKEMRLEPNEARSEIYIILRVYNLTSNNIGMRILVDPATLERQGKLLVEAENYTVLQQDKTNVGSR